MKLSRRIKIALAAVTLLALGAGVGMVLLIAKLTAEQEVGPSKDVPRAWRDVRDSVGHVSHVVYNKVPCAKCHTDNFKKPDVPKLCTTCHAQVTAPLHKAMAHGAKGPTCTDCHAFGANRAPATSACMRCHSQPQGELPAIGVHGAEACNQCHQPHGLVATTPRNCVECHPQQRSTHERIAGAQQCLDCHKPHEGANAADGSCVNCHATQKPIVGSKALFASGHVTCTGCHVPHAFARAEVKTCATCHTSQHVLGMSRGVHRECTTCHDNHDVRTPRTCMSCHNQIANHPVGTAPGIKPRGETRAIGAEACLGCHPIHQPPDQGKALACATCHIGHSGHARAACLDCHKPHTPKPVLTASLCTTCHGEKARTTAGTGHGACLQCHRSAAHVPEAPRPACTTCHTAEASSAPAGHSNCISCHAGAEHNPRTPRPACASCHKDRVRGHGAALACTTCHRAHGPSGVAVKPACTTCHAIAALPGLHQQAKHQNCTTCHDAHGAQPRSDRATCTTCHKDRVAHEPLAEKCSGCHPFSSAAGPKVTLRTRPTPAP
ncbi:MAG: hypothetical protein K8W52_14815 [Deltaproteobacteria bacterium]|nr:hypothetical protein [Deltaproteobacteria bacterium]